MSTQFDPIQLMDAVSAVQPDVTPVVEADPAMFGRAIAATAVGAAKHPVATASATFGLARTLTRVGSEMLRGSLVGPGESPVPLDPKDKRFSDPTWAQNAAFGALRQAYVAACDYTMKLLDIAELDPHTAGKAELGLSFLLDMLSPTNILGTNPAALKLAFETGGRSVGAGLRNFVDDVRHNGGRPRQVDSSQFEVGANLACTPSKVVYRNDLIEVLQYLPQTDEVSAVPLLCSPPWINKYYVMDLSPGRSLIEWAIKHGRTVFTISYRNPDESMASTTMDDYLVDGPLAAIEVVRDITGSNNVDLLGVCAGGALALIAAAYLNAVGDDIGGSITVINTIVDYTNVGALASFTDEAALKKIEQKMARKGYLEGKEMAGTFDMLRANDLIFNYVVSNWLMGKNPPVFDILAWNADSTRMAATMHSNYLRWLYLENRLVAGKLELAGQLIDLGNMKRDVYIVSAINDHIVPWTTAYQTTRATGGECRFVLSSGGHIAGIVNPPTPKAWIKVADTTPPTSDEWAAIAEQHSGSWWEDWAAWGNAHGGAVGKPPRLGSKKYPVLYEGPGEYVRI
ncbi:PHA/PHB synthase family protein [Mycolicibacterium gadium]|uniref:Alpha/beta fold hydrolase n=1 Tax=Mycolicibacterium gadium TaxID=1794 RepID=A0ABT6H0D0_MYCGU|nr:alpha/beta fold hydrolase [Mycolicibacterium gadium]MDG5486695.1 alpha/beta fold hydrolase [Mycolicibacterium gadium]